MPLGEIFRFPRAADELPHATRSGISSRPLLPQDKESFVSKASHEENVYFHFRGVSIFPLRYYFLLYLRKKLRSHTPRMCCVQIDWSGGRQRRHCEITSRCRACTRRCESVRMQRKSMGHFSSNISLSCSSINLRRIFLQL